MYVCTRLVSELTRHLQFMMKINTLLLQVIVLNYLSTQSLKDTELIPKIEDFRSPCAQDTTSTIKSNHSKIAGN